MTQALNQKIVHARFDGRSEELTMAALNLTEIAHDDQIKHAIAGHFDLPQHYLNDYVVVRTSKAIIVRPEAIYG